MKGTNCQVSARPQSQVIDLCYIIEYTQIQSDGVTHKRTINGGVMHGQSVSSPDESVY